MLPRGPWCQDTGPRNSSRQEHMEQKGREEAEPKCSTIERPKEPSSPSREHKTLLSSHQEENNSEEKCPEDIQEGRNMDGLEGKVAGEGQGPLCVCAICILHKGPCQGVRGGAGDPGCVLVLLEVPSSRPAAHRLHLTRGPPVYNAHRGPYMLVVSLSRSPSPAPLSRVPPHLQRGKYKKATALCLGTLLSLTQDKVPSSMP